ncbi:hypothetical protein QCN29_26945 [Streptomyces sp. HNM0663]|uniref:Uncharacterized protein n=1 Tax=Streptomyces chengmaiensis TaxID=3040919 RepID=A0ABT6HVD3_9ACTN|nr:hypothetical protein [Streptomyces chengmaiensis]MDH2392350.1 hypothetical protein [Streptomyces chengmaiensis]
MSTFDEIASAFTSSTDWYAAVQEAQGRLHREHPRGIDVAKIGHAAWKQLTPLQQARALDDLFVAYICRLHDEERAAALDAAAAEVKTYLEGEDEYLLHSALNEVRPSGIGTDTVVDGVCASALANVLDELDLLRHRLVMAKASDNGDDA